MKRIILLVSITITAWVGFVFYTTPDTPRKSLEKAENKTALPTPYLQMLDDYEGYINESLKLTGTPGAAIAIVHDSTIIYLKGFGVKNVGTGEPVDVHTAFRLGSVSKSVTSVMVGAMVAAKALDWDEPVVKYLPHFELKSPAYTQALTLRHVMSHTTGLPYHTYTNLIEEGLPHNELVSELKNVDLIGEPGKVYSYQNVAFSLMDDVVRSATGHSFGDEMEARLFGPLHMANASVGYEAFVHNPNVAQPHLLRGHQWKPIPVSPTYYNTAPAGGINASITDMAKLLVALLGNKENVVPQKTIDELFAPEIQATAKNRNFNKWKRIKRSYYGLGWRVLAFKNDTLAYHGGYVNGYRSEISVHPAKKIAICVLANGPSGFSDHAIPAFYNTYDKYFKTRESKPSPIAMP
ncbi:MAG TPA: serine hydrolase domain-containing protein [Cyclobacteriaceae bacterium]|nr:beta-lactamase family protein [Cyclobacteriaceae bacterium]MCB9237136.1 beta-lactamase family protein [Flammeovirgaceae bacterium]MCB0500136.1 beta-lactamase family protein [Cyclobacteriaceae bacterium]MCO5270845.1 beta-lactamase family protein [Cyclobacteriaceae bacterium]MCW5901869.1 beta-lactamase family protein [Cyclobacteriaceae bacterium]